MRRPAQLYPDARIAETLRKQGRRPARGQAYNRKLVTSLRHRHGIEVFRGVQREGEEPPLSVREAARDLGTTASTLYRWIQQGFVPTEEPVGGAPLRVRLSATVRARFCTSPPEGFVRAEQARRELGLSRQALWQRIREGAVEARRIVRGAEQGLYVKLERERLPLLDGLDEEGSDA